MNSTLRFALWALAALMILATGLAQAADPIPPLPGATLPAAHQLADGSWPWVSGTHFLWQYAMDMIKGRKAEPLSRERMIELGRLDESGRVRGIPEGGVQTFWAMNMVTKQPVQVRAVLRRIGRHCYIYVQEGHDMAEATVDRLASQFDDQIYPTDTTYFGQEWKPGVDWDERITLLFMDIQDGWEPGKGYVGGYFFPLDEYSSRVFAYSNEREITYLDIYPSDPTREDYLGVLAHEFQHMIHWKRHERESRWLNEAAAQLAFFVNGYGHAPQTFQFVAHADTGLEEFDNGIDDYGCVYLFFYYLHEKYAGATIDEKKAFFRDLCDNQEKSLASIRTTLAQHGVTRSLDEIFLDFAVANTANAPELNEGRWGYDETLKVMVEPSARYALDALPADAVKEEVQPWAADYLTVVPAVRWAPHRPTMVDQVTFTGAGAGTLEWTVNGGKLPPAKLVPAGSIVDEAAGVVRTPLAQNETGLWTAQIGRFVRLGTAIHSIDARFAYADGTAERCTVPVYSIETLASRSTRRVDNPAGFRFVFDGKKGKTFHLYKVVRTEAGVTVDPVAVDEKNHAVVELPTLPAGFVDATLVVAATDGKKLTYEYRVEPMGGTADLVGQAARLREIAVAAADQGVNGSAAAAAADRIEGALARLMTTSGSALTEMTDRFADASAAERTSLHPTVRSVLRRARYRLLDEATGGNGDVLAEAARLSADRADDEDDSHDNLGYFTWKKLDLIHALTHLKIDPNLIEGQILNTWTTLEISQGFPHLPIPDGLGLADFDDDRALGILKQWAADFSLDYPWPDGSAAPPTDRPVVACADLTKVKRVAQRLIMAEAVVEYCYNNGLTMADDMTGCLYDFIRLIMTATSAIDDIASNFEDLPLVGELVTKLKAKIHGKLVRVVQSLATVIAAKLPSPYSSVVPTAVQLLGWAYAKLMHLDLPGQNQNTMVKMGCTLLGKYALTAVPKVGYVARGQVAVDRSAARAATLDDEGTLEAAAARTNAVLERVATEIGTRHAAVARDRKIADVTRRLTEIFQYTSVLDPTVISKILGITSAVASTGVLAHGGYTSGRFFFTLPRTLALEGVEKAFGPLPAAFDPEGRDAQLLTAPLHASTVDGLLRELDRSMGRLRSLAAGANQAIADKSDGFAGRFDELMAEDDHFDEVASKLQAVVLADPSAMDRDEDAQELAGRGQASLLERAALMADLLAAYQTGAVLTDAAAGLDATRGFAGLVSGRVTTALKRQGIGAVVAVSRVDTVRQGDALTVTATVANLSDLDVRDLKARLTTGAAVTVTGAAEQTLAVLAGGTETTLTWTLTVDPTEKLELRMAGIELEGQGLRPVGGMVALD